MSLLNKVRSWFGGETEYHEVSIASSAPQPSVAGERPPDDSMHADYFHIICELGDAAKIATRAKSPAGMRERVQNAIDRAERRRMRVYDGKPAFPPDDPFDAR